MKKVLLVVLGLFSFVNIYSQDIEVFDKKFDSDGICVESFRLRIINTNSRVNRVNVLCYRQSQENQYGYPPLNPAYSKTLDRVVRTLTDGSKVYETGVVYVNMPDSYMNIEVKGQYRNITRNRTYWTEKTILTKCDLTDFKRYSLMSRGRTLEDARYNQCVENVGNITDINLKLPVVLSEGMLYSQYDNYYEVIDMFPAHRNADFTDASGFFSGPFSRFCDDIEEEEEEEENEDTSNYDILLKESNVNVYSACVECPSQLDILNPDFAGGTFPIRKHLMSTEGNTVETQLLIRNIGQTSSKKTEVNFYMSTGYNSLLGVNAVEKTIEIPNLASGEEYLTNQIFVLSDFSVAPGNYYLVIDVIENLGESDVSNNYVSIPIEVKSAASGIIFNNDVSDMKNYTIEIYNFNGTRHSSEVVNDS
ncbi:hypothetical protein D7035_21635, partial [Aquimarina sp. AD1]